MASSKKGSDEINQNTLSSGNIPPPSPCGCEYYLLIRTDHDSEHPTYQTRVLPLGTDSFVLPPLEGHTLYALEEGQFEAIEGLLCERNSRTVGEGQWVVAGLHFIPERAEALGVVIRFYRYGDPHSTMGMCLRRLGAEEVGRLDDEPEPEQNLPTRGSGSAMHTGSLHCATEGETSDLKSQLGETSAKPYREPRKNILSPSSLALDVDAVVANSTPSGDTESSNTSKGKNALLPKSRPDPGDIAKITTTDISPNELKKDRSIHVEVYNSEYLEMKALANKYIFEKRWKEAEALLEQVSDIQRKALGNLRSLERENLQTRHDLMRVYFNLGRFYDALKVGIPAVEERKKILGEEHEDTLKTMYILAFSYKGNMQLGVAEVTFRQCLRGRRKILGEYHEDTLDTEACLEAIMDELDSYREMMCDYDD